MKIYPVAQFDISTHFLGIFELYDFFDMVSGFHSSVEIKSMTGSVTTLLATHFKFYY